MQRRTSRRGRAIAAVASSVVCCAQYPPMAVAKAMAPSDEPAAETARTNDPTQTSLSEQMDLPRLVDLAAQRLKANIDYDAPSLLGKVTVRLSGRVSDGELWLLMNRALAAHGFTTIRTPGKLSYSVVKLAEAANLAQPVPAGIAANPNDPPPGYEAVLVNVTHRSVKDVVDAASKLANKAGGSVTALGETPEGGTILVSDQTPRAEQIVELIHQLDAPGAATTVTDMKLANISAPQAVTQVTQLATKRDAVAGDKTPGEVLPGPDGLTVLIVAPTSRLAYWRGLVEAVDKRERATTVTYTPRHFAPSEVAKLINDTIKPQADERFKVIEDPLTSSLLITTTPGVHEQIASLMARLEATPTGPRRPMKTFVIKNRAVKDVQAVLDQLVQTGVIGGSGGGGGVGGDDSSALSAPPASSTSASLTPLPPPPLTTPGSTSNPAPFTNRSASTPTGTSTSHATGSSSKTASAPDRPVMFTSDEATNTLIAIAEPRVLAQIETLLASIDIRQPQVMLEVLMVTLTEAQTLSLGVELDKLHLLGNPTYTLSSLFGLGTTSSTGDRAAPTAASGLTGFVLSPGDYSVLIQALESLNKGRSLSMPKMLVGNNQQATLDSVLQQPYASVNASNTVSTTSFGGTQDAGTSLSIKPHIAEGDYLVLDYSVSLSSFTGTAANANLPPPRQQNKVQSAASIPDGYTVVVGGIETKDEEKTTDQIPLLGSIPVIGEAFKNRNNSSSRSRFYVFIKASILRGRNFEDLKYLSAPDVRTAGVDPGWPVLEPRVIR